MSIDTCPELVNNHELVNQVDLGRYRRLHPDGRSLIRQWFRRAWRNKDSTPEYSFEPFIYTWLAFNGWAACVTNMDTDSRWRKALSITPELYDSFNDLAHNPDSSVYGPAQALYELWPIFKSSEIRHQQAFHRGHIDRKRIVQHYFDAGIEKYEPQCWKKHLEKNEVTPLDWPHTLAVLYRVRCNLFHGEKGIYVEMDRIIVHKAFLVLVHYISESELL